MKNRLLTTFIGLPLVIVVLIFSRTVVLPVAVTVFCMIGVYEMVSCLGFAKNPSVLFPSLAFTAFLTASSRYVVEKTGNLSSFISFFATLTFAYAFYLLCLAVFSKGKKDIAGVALVALATVYITVGFTCLILLRDMTAAGLKDYGICLFALVFVGAWIPDSAGYFGGRAFGKHKLIPEVSPKKTVEGAVCGVVFGAVAYSVTGLIFSLLGYGTPNYLALVLSGLAISVISIFGDLIASLIKRKYGVKDYGWLFPGHGGVMDRFDSIIAITPFLMMVCSHPDTLSLFR